METKRRLTLYNERKEKIKEWAKAMYPNEEHAEIFAVGWKFADMNPSPLVTEELIDKACEWLERELKEYITVQPYSTSANIDMDALLHDLKQAMKGDKK